MTVPLLRLNQACLFSDHSSFVCKARVTFSVSFCTDSEKHTLGVSEFLIQNHDFSPETASRVGFVLTRLKSFENADSVLSFFKESGFSNAQLEKIVKYVPQVLSANLERTIKPKIRIFQDLGLNDIEIADIISRLPIALYYSKNKIVSSLSLLKGLLGSDMEAVKFLRKSALYFGNLENTLLPNVEFLKICGVSVERISWIIRRDPLLFLLEPETMRKLAEKIDEMGLDRSSRMFVHALRVVSRMTNETWELKLKTFRELGFSEDDILRVFRNAPMVFATSEKKLKQVTKVLLETGKYDMSCIINCPTVFTKIIEKRYRPRLQVLRILEKKNLIKEWPAIRTLSVMSNDNFFDKFVAPYLDEVGEAWSAAIKLEEL